MIKRLILIFLTTLFFPSILLGQQIEGSQILDGTITAADIDSTTKPTFGGLTIANSTNHFETSFPVYDTSGLYPGLTITVPTISASPDPFVGSIFGFNAKVASITTDMASEPQFALIDYDSTNKVVYASALTLDVTNSIPSLYIDTDVHLLTEEGLPKSLYSDSNIASDGFYIQSQNYTMTAAPLAHNGHTYDFNFDTNTGGAAIILLNKSFYNLQVVTTNLTFPNDGLTNYGVLCAEVDIDGTILYFTVYFKNDDFVGGTNPSPGTNDSDYFDTWLGGFAFTPTVDYYRESFWTNNGSGNDYTFANPDGKVIVSGFTSPPTFNYISATTKVSINNQGIETSTINSIDGYELDGTTVIRGDTTNNNWFLLSSGNTTLTGSNNVGIGGGGALRSITTGEWNTGIGSGALSNTTEGSWNYALGKMAMTANTTGSGNIAIGDSALLEGTSPSQNIAIGGYTLRYNSQGSNIALGPSAGYSTLGSSGVFLGNEAGYYETGSNTLYIDNSKRDNEAGAKTKALIYGQFAPDPANQKLYVNGELYELSNRVLTSESDPVFTAWDKDYGDLSNTPTIPTKTSDLTNDSGFIDTESDPIFAASDAADITSTDISNWNAKQSALTGSISGTTNQVTVSANSNSVAGNITLSLPQDINTTSTPTFGYVNLQSYYLSQGAYYWQIMANGSMGADARAYLPLTKGSSGQVLTTDAATPAQWSWSSKQAEDATLTALASYNSNGLMTQTAADTFTARTITGTANQVTVTNGDGVAGNPTLSLPQSIDTGATVIFKKVNIATPSSGDTSIYQSRTYAPPYDAMYGGTWGNYFESTITSPSTGSGAFEIGTENILILSGNSALNSSSVSGYGLSFASILTGSYAKKLVGIQGAASNQGTATATDVIGAEASVSAQSTGTITNAIDFYAPEPYKAAGATITNAYGLKIDDIDLATNNYSIYTGTAPSYFGGNVTAPTLQVGSTAVGTNQVIRSADAFTFRANSSTEYIGNYFTFAPTMADYTYSSEGKGLQATTSVSGRTSSATTAGTWHGVYGLTNLAAYNAASIRGVTGVAQNTSSGTASSAMGFLCQVNNTSSGTITNAYGNYAVVNNTNASGTIGSAAAYYAPNPTNNGTMTTLYGLKVDSLTAGATNYSIHTGTAQSLLGGALRVNGNTTLGDASTDTVTHTGRMIVRTLASNPKDATPANRPACTVAEIAYYSGKLYLCTNASTPTWEAITSS